MLENVQLPNHELQRVLQHNSEFFIHFFLADEIEVGVPPFHLELFDLMVHAEVPKLGLAVPRGHAKTTLAKLAAIYYLLFTDYQYILYMSSASGHSVASVNNIVDFLESENFERVFGKVVFHKYQEGAGYYEFTMPNGKKCILKAFGSGQKVRGTNINGRRPQLILVDDLEDNDDGGNITTPDALMKLRRWVYGPFRKCVDKKKNKWIWIGNMMQDDQMLNDIIKSPHWYSRLYGCLLNDGSPLWEELWPLEALKQDFMEYQEANMVDIWFAEMMNMPMAMGNGMVSGEDMRYQAEIQPGDFTIGFITTDLAISNETWADDSVIVVHMWNEDIAKWQVAEYIAYHGIDPIAFFWEAIRLGQRWGIGVVGLESVAWQAAAKPIFEHLCLVHNIAGFVFVPCPARNKKTERIYMWVGLMKNDEYCLTEGDYAATQQLLVYDPKKKENDDDIIDAIAHGAFMVRNYSYEIWNQQTLGNNEKGLLIQAGISYSRI